MSSNSSTCDFFFPWIPPSCLNGVHLSRANSWHLSPWHVCHICWEIILHCGCFRAGVRAWVMEQERKSRQTHRAYIPQWDSDVLCDTLLHVNIETTLWCLYYYIHFSYKITDEIIYWLLIPHIKSPYRDYNIFGHMWHNFKIYLSHFDPYTRLYASCYLYIGQLEAERP